jgi:ProP effector
MKPRPSRSLGRGQKVVQLRPANNTNDAQSTPPPIEGPEVDILTVLKAVFPVFAEERPLKLGVFLDLKQQMPELDDAKLREAMGRHVTSDRYLRYCSYGAPRVDLDGRPVGKVSFKEAKFASRALAARAAAEQPRDPEKDWT